MIRITRSRSARCPLWTGASRVFSYRVRPARAATKLNPSGPKDASFDAIPVAAANEPNPLKSRPESLIRGKKWWTLDCAMCHGKDGDGKGETARDMKLTVADFTNPATLKDRSDGELLYISKNGHQDMPPERRNRSRTLSRTKPRNRETFRAAKRRKNAAYGASRGETSGNRASSEGAKERY